MDRIEQIQDLVLQLSAGNLDARGKLSNADDKYDSIIGGLNMLAERHSNSLKAQHDLNKSLETIKSDLHMKLDNVQTRWELALEGSRDGIWDWDIASGHVFYSARWEEMFDFEYNAAPTNRDTLLKLVHPDDAANMQAELDRYLNQECPYYEQELRMYNSKGTLIWTLHRASAIFDSHGQAIRIVGTTANITVRKSAERELSRTYDMLQRTNQVARIGAWEFDNTENKLYWSDTTKEIHKVQPDYIPDVNSSINFYKEGIDRDKIAHLFNLALTQAIPFDIELQMITANKNEIWVRAIGEADRQNGKIRRVFGTFQDIDKRKRAEIDLIKTREQAVIANNAKTGFLTNISHELRTPLNAVLGFSQVLQIENLTPRQHEILADIINGGKQLLTLLKDILDISKIESGDIKISKTPFSLHTMLKDIHYKLRSKTMEAGIDFQFESELGSQDNVYGDSSKLQQVLLNLLGNAVKFTKQGRVSLQVIYMENRFNFCISDTGIGIAQKDIENLFQPFQRVGSKPSASPGLNLAISQKIVEAMGGEILVSSSPESGSEFSFSVKLEEVASRSNEIASYEYSQPDYIGEQKKILIVDDDQINRLIINDFLQAYEFQLLEAVDGQDAIDKYSEWLPDLILLDLMMPVLDGYQACHKIRSVSKNNNLKIIAVTADAFEKTRDKALSSGFDDFLSKPIDLEVLIDTIGKILALKKDS